MPYGQQSSNMSSFMQPGLGLHHGAQLPMMGGFPWLSHQPLSQPPPSLDSMPGSSHMPSLTQPFDLFQQHARQPQHAQHAPEASGQAQHVTEAFQHPEHAQHGASQAQHAQQAAHTAQHTEGRDLSDSGAEQQAGALLPIDSAQTESGGMSAPAPLKLDSQRHVSSSHAEHQQESRPLPSTVSGMDLSGAALLQHVQQQQASDTQAGPFETALTQQDRFAQADSSTGSLLASEQLSSDSRGHRGGAKGGAAKGSSGLPKRQMNFWQEEEKTAFMNAYKVNLVCCAC